MQKPVDEAEHSQPDLFGVQFPVHMSSAKRNLNRQTAGGWGERSVEQMDG